MDLFSATLLVDLSAAEVTAQLAESARTIDRDTVEARCRQLVAWGNLVPAVGDARVSTVAEYIRSRSRYQVSKLRGRLHREAVAILHASDGAREVARELLGQIVQSLERILQMLDRREIDAEALAGEVTTVFGNQRLFTDSVRDFYAYLAGILGRYGLGGEEYAQFKELLLMYIDLITADVNRHAPAVAHRVNLVITWALRPPGRDRWSAMMRQRADLGLVAHLTVHELQRAAGLTRPGEIIHTCENPQVLQRLAAAGVQHPVACMSGNPSAAGMTLLARTVVLYHGDFDWPGIAIARRIFDRGARPWRFGRMDYVDAVDRLPVDNRLSLSGRPQATPWDERLSAAMTAANVAVHEELTVTSKPRCK